MIQNFFFNAIRNMKKNSGYLILNLTGLTIGITSFLLITLYVLNELSYDRFHKNYENIYRIKITGLMAGSAINQAVSAAPMAKALLTDYPEVESAVRIFKSGANTWLVKYGDTRFYDDALLFADSSFFTVFDFKLLKGDPKKALVNPKSVILTENIAKKYFGKEDPVGKRLSLEADSNLYTVTGVVQDIPSNSHFKFDMLCSLISLPNSRSTNWIGHSLYTYIVLKDGTRKREMEAKFPEMLLKYVGPQLKQFLGVTIEDFQKAGNQFRYELEPLKDIHLKGAPQYPLQVSGSMSNVYIFALIAILILVIAIINYINLATAKSAGRAKEVGIRKVSGSDKSGLVFQFIGESLIIVTIATIIASFFVLALTPLFNQLTGDGISNGIFSGYKGFLGLLLLVLFVGTAAGSYPAFVLASFNPVEVLKGTLSQGSGSKKLRGVLVVFQFSVSIVIIIGAMVVYRQINFMTSSQMGLEKRNLLVIKRPDILGNQIESFKEQILQIPGIEKAANATSIPGKLYSNNAFLLDNDATKATHLMMQDQISYGYPEALGIKLVAGRFFSKDYGTDTTAMLINETAVKSLGLKDPVGKYILQPSGPGQYVKRKIVGVMKDFQVESLHTRIAPVCFTFMSGNYPGYLCIRLNGKNVQETIRTVENLWSDYSNRQPFQYSFFDEEFNKQYEIELKTGKIFILFSSLAIFIACLGLIGLITYMTTIRSREIGIRKTFGASIYSIVVLLSREVVTLIIISSLISYPVAYFGIKAWLGGFAEKVNINPFIYIFASLTALAIGWLSIAYQTFKAANCNPSQSLRYK
jgi:putative ABC transport system permease protein